MASANAITLPLEKVKYLRNSKNEGEFSFCRYFLYFLRAALLVKL